MSLFFRRLLARLGAERPLSVGQIALLGAWFGSLSGLIDALAPILWLAVTGDPREARSPLNLWMAPLAGGLLGAAVGGLVGALLRLLRVGSLAVPVAVFAAFTIDSALLALKLPVHPYAGFLLSAGLAVQLGSLLERHRAGFGRLLRRSLPVLATGIVVASLAWWGAGRWREQRALSRLPAAAAGAPNVLLLILDTVRASELSLYGYARRTSPELERWAAGGTTFEAAIAPAPWTLPSHASMFTGKRPHELSTDTGTPLDRSEATLAELLARRGYATAGFVGNLIYCNRASGLARGFAVYRDFAFSPLAFVASSRWTRGLLDRLFSRVGRYDSQIPKRAEAVNREFLGWRRPAGRPFFAFLNYLDAHAPYVTQPLFATRFTPRPPRYWRFQPWAENGREELQEAIDAYDSAIAYLDQQLGNLLAALAGQGVLDNTLVIIAADHGEQFGEHNLTAHGNSLYLPLLHVPLVLRLPGRVPAGLRVREPVKLRDLAATVLDLIGVGDSLPGESLRPTWDPATPPARSGLNRFVLSEVSANRFANTGDPVRRGKMYSLLDAKLHYILNGDGVEELYDVQVDPAEHHNLKPFRRLDLAALRLWLQFKAPTAAKLLRKARPVIAGFSPGSSPGVFRSFASFSAP